jgi:NIPSNAP
MSPELDRRRFLQTSAVAAGSVLAAGVVPDTGVRAQMTGVASPSQSPERVANMLYELRVYHAVPGRLPDLLKRFDTITMGIWKKHGIEQAGFWTTGIGESNQTLHYFLKWESLADREKKWTAFQADPEWISARAETEKNGAIVARVENQILQPTSFSAVK